MKPQVFHTVEELRAVLVGHYTRREAVGFVPTMGALHEGHASLLARAAADCPVTVLSIFVNPTQFGPNEDFSQYPRTLDSDLELAEKHGVQYVFAPSAEVVYPRGWSTFVEMTGVTQPLCGAVRPGHFRGVATVVLRLFQIVRPQIAYFGQKDLQQCLVIERMARDLELPIKIAVCPTTRETDGLALSSRNRYLSAEERQKATVLYRSMEAIKKGFDSGERDVSALLAHAQAEFAKVPDFRVQYAEIRALPDLHEISVVERPAAFAIAGYLGKTRLIDNFILHP